MPDETKSIDDGAVLPWGSLMWDLMKQVCGAMGVRTNIPFNQLTDAERDIVQRPGRQEAYSIQTEERQ